jgi:hypothetical protein|tara:strand:+ start:172 stop:501 length:330 start_codon:yes stop_codon:yes gene_type:complete
MATKIKWKDADFKWEKAPTVGTPYTWDDVSLVEGVVSDGATGSAVLYNVDQLDPEEKKRFIKLVCKVRGIETYSGQKTVRDDITITAEDCEMVVKEVLGIELTVENIQI